MSNLEFRAFLELPQEAIEIRNEVFVDEQGFVDEFDSDDTTSTHIVGYIDGQAVATCRIITKDKFNYMLGRIAVRKQFRKKGIGAEIIKVAENIICQWQRYIHHNHKENVNIYIHSQLQAVPFYEKQGYVNTGEQDFEQECEHWMLKKILIDFKR